MQKYIEKIKESYENEREARAVFYRYMEDKHEFSRTDLCLGALQHLDKSQLDVIEADVERLAKGEPVQYVVGFECFCSLRFMVCEGVLIPRPETEELVNWILQDLSVTHPAILDIGSGSGAISVSLAKNSAAEVTAWDVSPVALQLTRENAALNNCTVNVICHDALNAPSNDHQLWDVIVSNPPYVCESESVDMDANVLDHEPHLALFVHDDDPLLFYRKITEYALNSLRPGGRLYFEINERFGQETLQMLSAMGFSATLRRDQYGKDRMIRALRS